MSGIAALNFREGQMEGRKEGRIISLYYDADLSVEEIAEKTVQCRFPIFRELPENLEMMTRGELAAYVRSIIKEDIYE